MSGFASGFGGGFGMASSPASPPNAAAAGFPSGGGFNVGGFNGGGFGNAPAAAYNGRQTGVGGLVDEFGELAVGSTWGVTNGQAGSGQAAAAGASFPVSFDGDRSVDFLGDFGSSGESAAAAQVFSRPEAFPMYMNSSMARVFVVGELGCSLCSDSLSIL
jgi:hypothetical protein